MLLDAFKSFLESASVRNKVLKFEGESSDKFRAFVRCQLNSSKCNDVDYDKCCAVFIKKFSFKTQTKWISIRRYMSKYYFRKTFVCYLSKKGKLADTGFSIYNIRDRQEDDCKARIDFKWMFGNSSCTYNVANSLESKLNCVVHIDFDHSHDLKYEPEDSLLVPSCTKEPKEYFYSYFKSGLAPTAAKNLHEIFISESAEDDNAAVIERANDEVNPTMSQVKCFYNDWKMDHNEPLVSTLKRLTKEKEEFENYGYHFSINNDTLDVAIVTPIMKRVFEEFSTRDYVVFIESSDSCSMSKGASPMTNLFLTFAFVSSKIGALPIACVIQTSENFQVSFTLLKETLERATRMHFSPRAIVTFGSTIQIIALKTVFPDSKVLLSVSHIRLNAWKWLSDPNNNVDMNDKTLIMKKFHYVLTATSMDSANKAFKELFKALSSKVKDNLRAINYFEGWWSRMSEMALPFHSHEIMPHDMNMDDCEASIRMLKSTLMHKIKGFNTVALVDLVCIVIEDYHLQRLRNLARWRDDRVSYHYSRFCETVTDADIMEASEDEFKVRCGRYLFTVHTGLAVCDCASGREGRYCEHLVSVENKLNLWPTWFRFRLHNDRELPVLSRADRAVLGRIVFGPLKVYGSAKTPLTFEYIDMMRYKQDEESEGNSEIAETKYMSNEPSRLCAEENLKPNNDCKEDFGSAEEKYDPVENCLGNADNIEEAENCLRNADSIEEVSCTSSALGVETVIKVKEENVVTNQEIFSNIRQEFDRLADLLESSGTDCASDLLQLHQLLQDVSTAEQAHRLVVSIAHKNS